MPKDFNPTPSIRELVSNPIFQKAYRTKKLENRFIDKADVFLCLSEKEAAAIAFPNLEGKLDYIGFKAQNEATLEWSKTLFTHYWNKATTQVPDQLLNQPNQSSTFTYTRRFQVGNAHILICNVFVPSSLLLCPFSLPIRRCAAALRLIRTGSSTQKKKLHYSKQSLLQLIR